MEVAPIAAPACKMPSQGKACSDQGEKHRPSLKAGEVELLLGPSTRPQGRKPKEQRYTVSLPGGNRGLLGQQYK